MSLCSGASILKIGGSLITDKAREGVFREDCARRLAEEISAFGRAVLLLHGTGSFGKPPARRFGYMHGLLSRDQAAIVSQVEAVLEDLRGQFLRVLRGAGVASCPLSPSALFSTRRGALSWCEAGPVVRMLTHGICPVISGGIVADEESGFAVLSSDVMAARLALALTPCRLVLATDVPGLIDHDAGSTAPNVVTENDSRLLARIERRADDVTGAMEGKLKAGFEAARGGVDVHLVDGRVPGRVLRVLDGTDVVSTRLVAHPPAR
jgi:glutamate 5-kinase